MALLGLKASMSAAGGQAYPDPHAVILQIRTRWRDLGRELLKAPDFKLEHRPNNKGTGGGHGNRGVPDGRGSGGYHAAIGR